jgi:transposase InsO family protein
MARRPASDLGGGERPASQDNSAMDSFFKTLKVELVHQQRYETREQARTDIMSWIEGFFNCQRIHSSIGYKTPIDAECRLIAA